MASKGMLKGRYNSNAKRGNIWQKYYSDKKPRKEVNDFVYKECEYCGAELILDYKNREQRFCNLSCAGKHNYKGQFAKKDNNAEPHKAEVKEDD